MFFTNAVPLNNPKQSCSLEAQKIVSQIKKNRFLKALVVPPPIFPFPYQATQKVFIQLNSLLCHGGVCWVGAVQEI